MNTLHIKKGETVVILSGNEKGKTGKVIAVFPKTSKVVVEGIGMHKKHQKSRREGIAGQIIEKQHAIHASKVMNVELRKEHTKTKTAKTPKVKTESKPKAAAKPKAAKKAAK